MKPSKTALQTLQTIEMVRTDGDINTVLSNTLLALLRKEITATDAQAVVGIADAMCRVVETHIKYSRLKLDASKAANEKAKLVELGKLTFLGESADA